MTLDNGNDDFDEFDDFEDYDGDPVIVLYLK